MSVRQDQISSDLSSDYEKLNTKKEVLVKRSSLPLSCPIDDSAIWCSHPRVSLAIELAGDEGVRCPYCGTVYRLQD